MSRAVEETIRSTLAAHSLWLREQDIREIAHNACRLSGPTEQRVRYVAHQIETRATPRDKPLERA